MEKRENIDEKISDIENRLRRAAMLHHRCMAGVIKKFMKYKEGDNFDISKHCIQQKKRVDTLLSDLQDYQ